MLDNLTLVTFTAHLNSRFNVTLGPDQVVDLELIEAEDLGSTPDQERFSLLFRGPIEHFLAQGLYPVTQAGLGQFELFLGPVQQQPTGFVYEAVFNRLRPR